MKSGSQLALQVLQERYAEQKAVQLLQGSSHTHCMELLEKRFADKLDGATLTSCEISDDKGKKITLKSREFDERLINAYVDQRREPTEFGLLSHTTVELASDCARWLRDGGGWSKSRRYSHVQDSKSRTLLKWNVFISFLWKQMLYKYNTHNMVDPWAESEMGKLITFRDICRKTNEAINKHGGKDLDQLIEKVYAQIQELLADRQFPPFEYITLPPGLPDPLALPEGDDEEEGGQNVE